jgi:hypothetical protein
VGIAGHAHHPHAFNNLIRVGFGLTFQRAHSARFRFDMDIPNKTPAIIPVPTAIAKDSRGLLTTLFAV